MPQINTIPHPWHWANQPCSLDLKWWTLTREATGANFSVFDLTRPGFESPTFHTLYPLGHRGGPWLVRLWMYMFSRTINMTYILCCCYCAFRDNLILHTYVICRFVKYLYGNQKVKSESSSSIWLCYIVHPLFIFNNLICDCVYVFEWSNSIKASFNIFR